MGLEDVNKPIVGFLIVVLAAILVTVIATQILGTTQKAFVANETLSIAPARLGDGTGDLNSSIVLTLANPVTGWKAGALDNCQITNFVLRNQTYDILAVTTNYVLDADAGTLTVENTNSLNQTGSNNTFVNYNYCQDSYLNSGFGRTTLNTVPGFLALFAVIGIIALVYILTRKVD